MYASIEDNAYEHHENVPEEEGYDVAYQESGVMNEAVSLHGLPGTEFPNAIRLKGQARKKKLTILLDSTSTHIFLDIETAKQIGCHIKEVVPFEAPVA